MIYREEQTWHPPLFKAVGCVCIFNGMVLLLRRQKHRSYPNRWGFPSGKIEKDESAVAAMIRELYEETGLLRSSDNLRHVDTFHVVTTDMSFLYTLYKCDLYLGVDIKINTDEHCEYSWFEPTEALRLDLVPDVDECLRIVLTELQPDQQQYDLFTRLPSNLPNNYNALESRVFLHENKEHKGWTNNDVKNYWASFGPPGAGKSTTLRLMSKINPSLTLIQDQTIMNKPSSNLRIYLKKAWEKNLRGFFFHFQMEVLPFRFKYTMESPNYSLVDETIYSTLAYSRALHSLRWINDNEYKTFYANYITYFRLMPRPITLFYFRCDQSTLLSRISKRGRKIETLYPLEYTEILASMFEAVAAELNDFINVEIIDTDGITPTELAKAHVPN